MVKLAKATFEKVLKESSKDIRVSDPAARALAEVIAQISREIAADAAELAKHANRKTILEQDVKLASKRWL